ncbi:MAG TPA: hypothetical protein VGV37_27825 [Aliidongia sp.]|uniref:hypothetical protein n=1 Tax=Aliidongia sp. TaxID=1914230 RepID=UPI002DDD9CDF|nr:hypothetical protein [Aliidongia sp.]HEV2678369.1 hypothetical protein [Aliidongia sp.]
MNDLDRSFDKAKEIFSDVRLNQENISSEEDAKIQIINRILIESLGWHAAELSAERKNENGYSDYIVFNGKRRFFLVEAKRQDLISVSTQARTRQDYKISGPALKPALRGIEQAASYCAPLGIPLAVVTDGATWIIFKPYIQDDSYQDRQAIVFPGYDAVLSDFSTFYELLSKDSCQKNLYKVIFDKVHENRLFVSQILKSAISEFDLRIEQKSALAFDLEPVFSKFFSALTGDDDPDLIINCFVETKESRVADFSLEKITENVLGNVAPVNKTVDEGLNSIIESTIDGELGQTVFIVGPTGAGKSTFLDRFFKKTLSKAIRELCVVININALDASGNERTSIGWMTGQIITSIEKQIFKDGFPNWNDLQALYQGDYVRRSKGVDAQLYNRDKQAFKEKFGQYMDDQVERDREGYLSRLLRDVVDNRKKLPILVVDNTDEFGLEYKEKIFQYCQSIRRGANHCLLIFPATDKSAWQFSKTDIFNIYASKSFFLPTPSPREVFRKRVDYLRGKISDFGVGKTKAGYFMNKGIKVTIPNLEGFASLVENIFVDQDFASRCIGEISNYNIRKTLKLSKRVITSAYLDIEDIVKYYIVGQIKTPSQEGFMSALMCGDYNYFKNDDDHHIFSIFQVSPGIRQSPLLYLRILLLLRLKHLASDEDENRYLSAQSIYQYFDIIGISELSIEKSLLALLESELIEPYDLSAPDLSQSQKLAITHSGLAHIEMALFNPVYFEQMALTTRIPDLEVVKRLQEILHSDATYDEYTAQLRDVFATYLRAEDAKYTVFPTSVNFDEQRNLAADIVNQWKIAEAPRGDRRDPIAIRAQYGLVSEGLIPSP